MIMKELLCDIYGLDLLKTLLSTFPDFDLFEFDIDIHLYVLYISWEKELGAAFLNLEISVEEDHRQIDNIFQWTWNTQSYPQEVAGNQLGTTEKDTMETESIVKQLHL